LLPRLLTLLPLLLRKIGVLMKLSLTGLLMASQLLLLLQLQLLLLPQLPAQHSK
jgi:hypothetical protein